MFHASLEFYIKNSLHFLHPPTRFEQFPLYSVVLCPKLIFALELLGTVDVRNMSKTLRPFMCIVSKWLLVALLTKSEIYVVKYSIASKSHSGYSWNPSSAFLNGY